MSKLGWYFETVEGWTTLLKDKEPYFDWDSSGFDCMPTNGQKAELLGFLNSQERMLTACKEAFGVLTEPGMMDIDMWKSWKQDTINKLHAAIAAAKGGAS